MPCLMSYESIIKKASNIEEPLGYCGGIEGYRKMVAGYLSKIAIMLKENIEVEKIESKLRNYIDSEMGCLTDNLLNLKAAEKKLEKEEREIVSRRSCAELRLVGEDMDW